LISEQVNALVIDEQGNLWVGGYGGLNMLAPDGKWTTYTKDNSGLNGGYVFSLVFDKQGNLWIGGNGVNMLAPDGEWVTYTTANSDLNSDDVFVLTIDRNGNLWVGTGIGLNKLDPTGSWETYPEFTTGFPLFVSFRDMVVDSNDNLWIATAEGVSKLSPDGQWTEHTASATVTGFPINSMIFDETGSLWIGAYSGFSKLNPDEIKPASQVDTSSINSLLFLDRVKPVINLLLISAILFLTIVVIWPFEWSKTLKKRE